MAPAKRWLACLHEWVFGRPLADLVREGDVRAVRQVATRRNVNTLGARGRGYIPEPLLGIAASDGNLAMVQALLEAGANTDLCSSLGTSKICAACAPCFVVISKTTPLALHRCTAASLTPCQYSRLSVRLPYPTHSHPLQASHLSQRRCFMATETLHGPL